MDVNFLTILVCAVLSMIVGAIWFGPMFGKKWMEICQVDASDIEARKKMQKEAAPLYVIQFVLALVQIYILSELIHFTNAGAKSVWVAVFMWLGFVIPTLAGSAMWNNDSNKIKWARFLIQSGYQLVMFVIFGYVLGMWG